MDESRVKDFFRRYKKYLSDLKQYGAQVQKTPFEKATGGLRQRSSYTHSLNDVIELVTLSKSTMPVGSFKYVTPVERARKGLFSDFNNSLTFGQVQRS